MGRVQLHKRRIGYVFVSRGVKRRVEGVVFIFSRVVRLGWVVIESCWNIEGENGMDGAGLGGWLDRWKCGS